ncbi:hypothetical protein ONS95_008762 [Cadophora gregata]|uniref:uncharacterized protein n=1 Tax=Cadophora gregata TaxID=51156 RepID=UPI0026DC6490|nr:uncharacterized protein ONS95_008762 [Cadophora gregata]KAK0123755.1 hypothetical protein ONS95_008762 [Cadophora gregata]
MVSRPATSRGSDSIRQRLFPVITHARGPYRIWNPTVQTARLIAEDTPATTAPAPPSMSSQILGQSSTRTFTLFPLLPAELQLHIWTIVFASQRVIPIYSAPFTYTSRCALLRFLLTCRTVGNIEIPTLPHPALASAPYACKTSHDVYRRTFHSMTLIRSDRKMVSLVFNPRYDVVFFKMGLSSKMHTSLSLEAFVNFQPAAATSLRMIAVETIGEVGEFATALRGFDRLEKLVVVLPAVREVDTANNLTDVAGNEDGWDQRGWELGLSIERAENVNDLKKRVQELVEGEMERLKREKWERWTVPSLSIVETWEEILGI